MHDLSYRCLAKFIGIIMETNIIYTVHEEYSMGSLYQLLHNPTKKLDNAYKFSFALDIIKVCACICAHMCACVYVCVHELCACVWCVLVHVCGVCTYVQFVCGGIAKLS